MRILILTSLFTTVIFASNTRAANQCAQIFAKPPVIANVQNSILELAKFKLDLDLKKIKGTETLEQTILEADFKTKEKELLAYLTSHQLMTREVFIEKMRQEIATLQKNQKPKNEEEEIRLRKEQNQHVEDFAEAYGYEAAFHPVALGSVEMGLGATKKTIQLKQPFEMMATPVTQEIWRKIVELPDGPLLNPAPSSYESATGPVNNVSFNTVKKWIDAVNKLSKAGDPNLETILVGHKKGDVYRLPTDLEWELVASARNKEAPLTDYAWIDENSNGKPSPVATRKAVVIDGKKFFDMHGNVQEFIGNDHFLMSNLHLTNSVVARGTSYLSSQAKGTLFDRHQVNEIYAHDDVGFRLVRGDRLN